MTHVCSTQVPSSPSTRCRCPLTASAGLVLTSCVLDASDVASLSRHLLALGELAPQLRVLLCEGGGIRGADALP